LNYTVDAQVGGKVAQLGSRLIDSTAKKLAAEFFTNFATIVAPIASTEPAVEQKPGWLRRFSGVASIAVLLVLGGANWCCILATHHHTTSDDILASSICSSRR
jgi:hypothetical protein